MAIEISKVIQDWVPRGSKIVDFGCGDGTLLKKLMDEKDVQGYGVEINDKKILSCIEKNVPVIKLDIDLGLHDFEFSSFDMSIMARSIQCLRNPNIALEKMLSLSKTCVVTLPNLGYWRCRINLAVGKMPVTPDLPSSWYETENIHLCTIRDFENLCEEQSITIKEKFFMGPKNKKGIMSSINPNFFATEGVYLLEKK